MLVLLQVLITQHGEVNSGRFHDPKSKQQFHYDHLRKVGWLWECSSQAWTCWVFFMVPSLSFFEHPIISSGLSQYYFWLQVPFTQFHPTVLQYIPIHSLPHSQESSDPAPHEADAKAEPWRAAIDDAFRGYVKDHYPFGVCTVSVAISHTNHSWTLDWWWLMMHSVVMSKTHGSR